MAITAGFYTVGSGGNYSTWATAWADIGSTLTGDLTLTQISDTTESGGTNKNIAYAGYKLTITSNNPHLGNFNNGWKINVTYAGAAHLWTLNTSSSSSASTELEISNLYFRKVGAPANNVVWAFIVLYTQTNISNNIHNIIMDGLGHYCSGIAYANGTSSNQKCYNCIVTNIPSGLNNGYGFSSLAGGIFENCTVYVSRIGFWNYGNSVAFVLKNVVALGQTVASFAYGTGATLGLGNSTASKCASSDITGSEASLRSLTAANEFESLTLTDATFLKVKSTGQLANGGTTATITGNTTGIRGNARPH